MISVGIWQRFSDFSAELAPDLDQGVITLSDEAEQASQVKPTTSPQLKVQPECLKARIRYKGTRTAQYGNCSVCMAHWTAVDLLEIQAHAVDPCVLQWRSARGSNLVPAAETTKNPTEKGPCPTLFPFRS